MHNQNDDSLKLDLRKFLKTSALSLGVAGLAGISKARAAEVWLPPLSHSLIAANDTILFQGDSITDASRSRETAKEPNTQSALGTGYAWFAAAEMLVDRPKDNLKIFNRGVSGNKVFQLADRWQEDCLDLKPNLLSILIGVNDIWHTLNHQYQGTVEIYERDYRALLERTKKALPKVKLVICEPFVLHCGAVNANWFPEFDHYRAAAKSIAESFHATFVPFQAMFDEAVKYAAPDHWSKDGVHPSPAGAALMAHTWLQVVNGKK